VTQLGACTNKSVHIGAILLAAGSGSRLGHQPKCLLELEGVPLIRRQLTALTQVGITELVVVLGQHADRIAPVLHDLAIHIVRNSDPGAVQNASLHLGLQALSNQIDTVLVALADQPLIDAQDILDLIASYVGRATGIEVVQPQISGLPGNPVIFSGRVLTDILRGKSSDGCRAWQMAHPTHVLRWETENPHYRLDIDNQEDIDAFARHTGHNLRWPPDLAHGSSLTTVATRPTVPTNEQR
jgi:molybdenum cofactor cytidylyltransferase